MGSRPSFIPFLPIRFRDISANWIACNNHLSMSGKIFFRILVTQKDLIHKMGKDLIGHAGHGILFLDCRRYPFHGAPKGQARKHSRPCL